MPDFRQIVASSGLTARALCRSGAFRGATVLLIASVVGLSFLFCGDGTPDGDFRVVFSYTLMTGWIVSGFAALIAGCAAGAGDIDQSRIHLLRVKPVSGTVFWWGSWLGLLRIQLGAALLTGLLTAVVLSVRFGPETFMTQTSRITVPAGASADYIALENGMTNTLAFGSAFADPDTRLRVRFDPLIGNRAGVNLAVKTSARTTTIQSFTQNELNIPLGAFDGSVDLIHDGKQGEPALLYRTAKDVRILEPGLPFWANLLLVQLAHFAVLGLLAGVGLLLGVSFSLPVAVFVGTLLLTVVTVAPTDATEIDTSVRRNRAGYVIARGVEVVLMPLTRAEPIARAEDKDLIDPAALAWLSFCYLLLYPAGLAVLSAAVLRRREYF